MLDERQQVIVPSDQVIRRFDVQGQKGAENWQIQSISQAWFGDNDRRDDFRMKHENVHQIIHLLH